jgi:thiol-disulfide isomerase/thioredoxin
MSFLSRIVVTILAVFSCGLPQLTAEDLPVADPGRWIHSPPLTKEMLSGKAVVFYFVEEECPNCARRWPGVLETAAKFQGQPVLFVVVNSGTSRSEFEGYLRRNNVTWPAINDWDRSFERQFGYEISLENICQVEVLMPDGAFEPGDFNDLEGTAKEAAKSAQWKVEPKEIPDGLRDAWLAIEFGSYPDAARAITKNIDGKGALGTAAQLLNKFVQDDLTAKIAAAQKHLDEGDSWEAFKGFSVIPVRFKGYEVPADVNSRISELSKNDAVKQELAAQKLLTKAQQTAAKGPASLKGAVKQLQSLVKLHPETEAGAQAQQYLDQINSPPARENPAPTPK